MGMLCVLLGVFNIQSLCVALPLLLLGNDAGGMQQSAERHR